MLRRAPKQPNQEPQKFSMTINFTLDELLLLRRALNALKTRQELNLISCSEHTCEAIKDTINRLESVDQKLLCIKPTAK